MAFDVTVQPLGFNISAPTDEEIEAVPPGGEVGVEFAVTVGLQLPFQPAPGQPPLMVPLGNIRIPLSGEIAVQIGEKLAEEGARVPTKPPIDIANSLEGLDQAQNFERRLRGD